MLTENTITAAEVTGMYEYIDRFQKFRELCTARDIGLTDCEIMQLWQGYNPNQETTSGIPASAPPSTLGNSFIAETLTADKLSEKWYWKVIGGNFTKHGVRVWPETLAAAGIVDLDPMNPPSIAGWIAEYVTNGNDKPKKVVRLIPKV